MRDTKWKPAFMPLQLTTTIAPTARSLIQESLITQREPNFPTHWQQAQVSAFRRCLDQPQELGAALDALKLKLAHSLGTPAVEQPRGILRDVDLTRSTACLNP